MAILLVVFGAGLLFLTALAVQPWVPVADLLRDPLAVAERSPTCCKVYFGFVSSIGSILWFMTAAACLFAAAILWALSWRDTRVAFLAAAALLTAWLGLDDLFLLHDHVLPELGVPELATYAIYGSMALAYLVVFRREILRARTTLFLAAGTMLALSIGIDVLVYNQHPLRILFEDGAKLIGIALWAAFHVSAGLDCVLDACRSGAGPSLRREALEGAAR